MRYIGQPAEKRTHSQVIRDMHIAYITENTVNGFKGPSALMSLKGKHAEAFISAFIGVALNNQLQQS